MNFRILTRRSVLILILSNCFNYSNAEAKKVNTRQILEQQENNVFNDEVISDQEDHEFPKSKPNILLILADDVGTGDVPAYWNSSLVDMPNLDRLSSMGVTFMDAHSTPLCAPSRYMLLSGNYAHRGHRPNGSWNWRGNGNQFRKVQKGIAKVLRDKVGYHTGMFGKWHMGAGAPTKDGTQATNNDFKRVLTSSTFNWTQPLIEGPQNIGFEKSYITMGGIQSPPYSFFRDGILATDLDDVRLWTAGSYSREHGVSKVIKKGEGDIDWESTTYNMILVNETEKFIDDHLQNNPNDPFFAYIALGAAHAPHTPPITYLDGSVVAEEYDTPHLDILLEMDKVVGSLVSMIEDRRLEKDTIIIFTSDNGGLSDSSQTGHLTSGPLRGEKGHIFEGGHRVPLIFRYDGTFPSDERRNEVVGLNDIYATICELVGIEIPAGSAQDSISFANYIHSSQNKEGLRDYLGTWALAENGPQKAQAIRFNSFKLIHYLGTTKYELYDLHEDISETQDLIGDSDHTAMVTAMKNRLTEIGPCPTIDRKGKFAISRLNGKRRGCKWFKRNNRKRRCRNHVEGELYCFSVCGRNRYICDRL